MVCPEFSNLGCIYQRYSIHAFHFASIASDTQFLLTSSRDSMSSFLVSYLRVRLAWSDLNEKFSCFLKCQVDSHFRRQFHLGRQWLIVNPNCPCEMGNLMWRKTERGHFCHSSQCGQPFICIQLLSIPFNFSPPS